MKYNLLLKLILFCFVCAFIATSCVKEGPMGPAGADGTDGTNGANGRDGVDGKVTCQVCHSGTNMDAKQAEFAMSIHSSGAIAVDYAGGRAACARCHSHEGFTQFSVFNSVLGDITNPSAWKCNTCHGLHKTFEGTDYALRMDDPIVPVAPANGVMDLKGNNNLCGTCHQSRSAEPNKDKPGETYTMGVRTYPHYSAQGNILYGNGLAEIAGSVTYPTKGTSNHLTMTGGSCVGCHMGTFTAKQGGHSFIPSLKACNDCHGGTPGTDYNYGGIQTDTKEKLEQLNAKLLALGLITETIEDGEVHYSPKPGTVPMVHAQAVFNYFGIKYDRSYGVHNPKYVKAILQNTIEALN
jgi:hypothetical protein